MANEEEKLRLEDEIDACTLPKALKMCREHGISTGGNTKLSEIKLLLKYKLVCQESDPIDVTSFLTPKRRNTDQQKTDLSDIYENVIKFSTHLKNTSGTVISELNTEFGAVYDTFETARQTMMNAVPLVLILGETGSGKSSFINLLLGEKYFPSSILSTTHVICEIRYPEDKEKPYPHAIFYYADDSKGEPKVIKSDETEEGHKAFVEELKTHTRLIENERAVYKLAKVYVKCDILKSGLVIVDSPGIGESKEMDEIVAGYMVNADVFIYIIDVMNAGGMQDRVTKLVQKVHKLALEDKKICQPGCAMFICNKWDDVKTKERDLVSKAVHQKIKAAWPKCMDDQIFRFSSTEADYIQTKFRDSQKNGIAPKYKAILQKMGHLIEVGQDVIVLKSYSQLNHFIDRCIQRFDTHLSQMDMTIEQRNQKYEKTKNRLDKLKSNISNFFKKQSDMIQDRVNSIVTSLRDYINKQENKQKVCSFTAAELPKRQGWKNACVEVRSKVYTSLHALIKEWEAEDTLFGELSKDIEAAFDNEFPEFERQIYRAERVMSSKETEDVVEDTGLHLMPEFLQNKLANFGKGSRIAWSIGLSPILLAHLTVVGVRQLSRFITQFTLEREYDEAKGDTETIKQICHKYASKIVDDMTQKINLKTIIEENLHPIRNYLHQQQCRMEGQIESDIRLLQTLRHEEMEDEYILKVSEPLKSKCLIIQHCLWYFMLQYMPSNLSPWLNVFPTEMIEPSQTRICDGRMSTVVAARCKDQALVDGKQRISVLLTKEGVTRHRMARYLNVLEAFRIINNTHIVHCYGFLKDTSGPKLNPVLEGLRCSLRHYVTEDEFCSNYDNNCVKVMIEVVKGLKFLHDKKLVHLDLSLDTVAVNFENVVKLTNISSQVKLNIEPVIENRKVCLSSYIHIAPQFFQNQNTEVYDISGDMFSVGIMMYELWTHNGLVSIGKLYDVPVPESDHPTDDGAGELMGSMEITIKTIYKRSSYMNSPIQADMRSSITESYHEDGDQVDGRHKKENKRWFQTFLKSHHPNLQKDVFNLDSDRPDLVKKWRQGINDCIQCDGHMDSTKWLDAWENYPLYPSVTLVE